MDVEKYQFYANPPIQQKDTVKFVQLTVHANLITKKLGAGNNVGTKRKLFHYNIVPNKAKHLTVTSGGTSVRDSEASLDTSLNESDMPELTDDNISEASSSVSQRLKRFRRYGWYQKKQKYLDADLDKYMNAGSAKKNLDRELDEYMRKGKLASIEPVEIKEEKDEEMPLAAPASPAEKQPEEFEDY